MKRSFLKSKGISGAGVVICTSLSLRPLEYLRSSFPLEIRLKLSGGKLQSLMSRDLNSLIVSWALILQFNSNLFDAKRNLTSETGSCTIPIYFSAERLGGISQDLHI